MEYENISIVRPVGLEDRDEIEIVRLCPTGSIIFWDSFVLIQHCDPNDNNSVTLFEKNTLFSPKFIMSTYLKFINNCLYTLNRAQPPPFMQHIFYQIGVFECSGPMGWQRTTCVFLNPHFILVSLNAIKKVVGEPTAHYRIRVHLPFPYPFPPSCSFTISLSVNYVHSNEFLNYALFKLHANWDIFKLHANWVHIYEFLNYALFKLHANWDIFKLHANCVHINEFLNYALFKLHGNWDIFELHANWDIFKLHANWVHIYEFLNYALFKLHANWDIFKLHANCVHINEFLNYALFKLHDYNQEPLNFWKSPDSLIRKSGDVGSDLYACGYNFDSGDGLQILPITPESLNNTGDINLNSGVPGVIVFNSDGSPVGLCSAGDDCSVPRGKTVPILITNILKDINKYPDLLN
ncbi:uncharacterized protein LOC102357974 [Latimeria chalumnae]|uniref:uncharacterized protein LOC102357974 n=1 Tax=Latimeria chalumnae TaxID=7897 RepID=UPI0003C1AC4E|nr:PREDICTED: uncharacterized protein LOC102357974 isoform X1 [Latimeria chalumnae]XP_005997975.1 PREDICTED: uncharacterized protein LOC102357974 isoform X1 [Latimeria chalumnae]|eukprot:XP_005997974.1 PREDICTED: uncharacterized protein LOC102357974 isoform X1 [Latimeria chalumnae]